MKHLIVFLLLTSTLSLAAQRTDSIISKKKIGLIETEFVKVKEKDSIHYYVSLKFADGRYPALREMESVFLFEQVAIDTLILNLQKAKIQTGGTVTWSIETADYLLMVTEKQKWIALFNPKGAFTNLTLAQTDKLIAWLQTIKFPASE